MKRVMWRALCTLTGAVGLIAVTAGTAAAGTNLNHAEPFLEPQGR